MTNSMSGDGWLAYVTHSLHITIHRKYYKPFMILTYLQKFVI